MKPSEIILAKVRAKLDAEKDKGAILFPDGTIVDTTLDAILEYLDEAHSK